MKLPVKLLGIIFALGYLLTFLAVWIYQTGFQSYTYIVVGEPNLFIKYSEWVVGLIAVGYLISEGKRELDNIACQKSSVVSYNPLCYDCKDCCRAKANSNRRREG